MEKIIENLKEKLRNKNFLFFFVASCIALIIIIILILADNKEKAIAPVAPAVIDNKISDEDIKNSVNVIKPGEEKEAISDDAIKGSVGAGE